MRLLFSSLLLISVHAFTQDTLRQINGHWFGFDQVYFLYADGHFTYCSTGHCTLHQNVGYGTYLRKRNRITFNFQTAPIPSDSVYAFHFYAQPDTIPGGIQHVFKRKKDHFVRNREKRNPLHVRKPKELPYIMKFIPTLPHH